MELIHAAILLHEAKKDVNEDNVNKLLSSVGIHKEAAQIKSLIAALEGVNIDDVIKNATVAQVAAPVSAEAKPKKEEKKEEVKEAAAGLGALFG